MSSASKSCCGRCTGSCVGPQSKVHQAPRFENQVLARKSKVIRADKRRCKRKFL